MHISKNAHMVQKTKRNVLTNIGSNTQQMVKVGMKKRQIVAWGEGPSHLWVEKNF